MAVNYMYRKLKNHIGHNVVCVVYGDIENPHDVCIECEDCCEVLVSAESFNEDGDLEVNEDRDPESAAWEDDSDRGCGDAHQTNVLAIV